MSTISMQKALKIEDYSKWANTNRNTVAALSANREHLEAASGKIGFLDRFFNTAAAKDARGMRGDVMKDFTRVLSNKFGVTIAQQAISGAKLTATSELTGKTISRVIRSAENLFEKSLYSDFRSDLRLADTTIERKNFGGLGAETQKFLGDFVRLRSRVNDLMGEMPLTKADYEDFGERAAFLTLELLNMTNGERKIPDNVPAKEFCAAVKELVEAIARRTGEVKRLTDGAPYGEANIGDYKKFVCDVVVSTLKASAQMANRSGRKDAAAALEKVAADFINPESETRKAFVRELKPSKNILKTILPRVAQMFMEGLAREGVDGLGISEKKLVNLMDRQSRNVLNRYDWPVISKSVSANMGKSIVAMTSTITPAGQLGRTEQSPRGIIGGRYPKGVNGFMCQSADAKHAVNLAVSQISVADENGRPQLAFYGVRHGVHCAWEITNADDRANANAKRTEEAVIAAFMAKYSVPGKIDELPQADSHGVINVNLDITSVSLLTPDKTRQFLKKGSHKDERSMLEDQTKAWDAVQKSHVTFQFDGKTICVKPKILKFNFGVNEGAVKYGSIAPNIAGGWDFSDSMNKTAFEHLEKKAMGFINGHKDDPKARAALTLLTQCRGVLDLKTNRVDGHDAYKIAARVAVLAQLTGQVPCWNCKSGKDRTGEMDVECKFLSVLIARGEQIPEPGAPLTEEQKSLFRAIALQGGNFELQKLNTGLAGFKSGSVSSIAERLGGKDYSEFHRGASDHVHT